MSVFQPISFESMKVGKIIKSSKMRLLWKVLLDGLDYDVTMFYSKISTKVKVVVNGEIVLCTKATEQHLYKFNIRYRELFVVKSGDVFDLRFEGLSFSALLAAREKEKREPPLRLSVQKTQLRRSLPGNLPADVPSICFRKRVADTDLLGISNNNPFDSLDDFEQSRMSKTANAFQDKTGVPWPNDKLIALSMKKLI